MTIKELPSSERPYEKLEFYGESSLSNAELLAIIIKIGTKDETSVAIAQRLLMLNDSFENDSLNFLRELSIEELMQVKGIGKVKAIQIKAVCELAMRINRPMDCNKIIINNPNEAAELFMPEYRHNKRENAIVVILNNKNVVLKTKTISLGTSNYAELKIKDVLNEAIKMQAPKIIFIHNHPTGDSTPSESDIEFTLKLEEASKLMGITLADHIVIGNMEYTSIFSLLNKMKKQKERIEK